MTEGSLEPSDEVSAFFAGWPPETEAVVLWLRQQVMRAEPEFTERVYKGWNGVGYRHPRAGLVCAIYPQANGTVRLLFEHGVELDDPDGFLEGTGTQTRYLTSTEPSSDLAARIEGFVDESVARHLHR